MFMHDVGECIEKLRTRVERRRALELLNGAARLAP
jgi:hypothetical protein